jgi:hypothetical protein
VQITAAYRVLSNICYAAAYSKMRTSTTLRRQPYRRADQAGFEINRDHTPHAGFLEFGYQIVRRTRQLQSARQQTGTIRSGIWTACLRFLRLQIKSIQRRSWKISTMCKSCTIHVGTRMLPWSNTRVSNIYASGSELRHQAPTSSCIYSSIAPR